MDSEAVRRDLERTRRNRDALLDKPNLLFWYQRLYEHLLGRPEETAGQRILELGSGTSPLKRFYPEVLTSDILPLEHVDFVLDAHELGCFAPIADGSLDVITMTNVLHHLQDPVRALVSAHRKLRPGGRIALAEPYFSSVSRLVYLRLHLEPTDLTPASPRLEHVEGPLSTANIALPHLIFWGGRGWDEELLRWYRVDPERTSFFTCLSYFATGGISHRLPVPGALYRAAWGVDALLASRFPRQLASFFCLSLVKR